MFIDYLSLLLINMAAGLCLLALCVLQGFDDQDQHQWIAGFGISGLIAVIAGFHMTWTWPLPGSYNIAFGEMSILLGGLFLGAACSFAFKWKLTSLAVYAFFSGLASFIIGVRIIHLGLTSNPVLSGIGFIITGLSGMLVAPGLYLHKHKALRVSAAVLLMCAAIIWAFTGYMAYWGHLDRLSKWVPLIMR